MSRFDDALTALASPDESVRNPALGVFWRGFPYATPHELEDVGAELLARTQEGPVWQRTFAAVGLAYLPGHGVWDDAWTAPFVDWWAGETDVRGHDPEVGWIHAVAHGADVIGELGLHAKAPVDVLADALLRRLLNPCPGVWWEQEDDRMAVAWAQVYAHPETTEAQVRSHFARLREAVEPLRGVVPLPARFVNATRTVSRLYVVADGPLPGLGTSLPLRHVVTGEARATLETIEPWSRAG